MRRAALLALLTLTCITVSTYADITTGLIAWWEFDGNLADSSGNGNHGSPVGGLLPTTDRYAMQNRAYQFNGTNSYVTIPNSTSLSSPDTALTQAAWVLFDGPSQVGQPFGPVTMKSTSGENAFMYRMTSTPGSGMGVAFNNWNTAFGTSYPFALGQWYHVASVFGDGAVRFYINGAVVDSVAAPVTMGQDARDMTIGGDIPGILEIFWGKIDDVRLYSRALSDADIEELCGCPNTGVASAPSLPAHAIRRTYPNPSAGETHVDFFLGSDERVELSVYDVAGRRVRVLRTGPLSGGEHVALWDGRDASGSQVPSGVYFIRLAAGGEVVSSRTIRIR